MRYIVTLDGEERTVEVTPDGVRLDGVDTPAHLRHVDGTDRYSLVLGDRSFDLFASAQRKGEWDLVIDGNHHSAETIDERAHHIRSMAVAMGGPTGPKPVKAPMPGLIVRVEVAEGDVVSPGQGLVIVEAMKMENELKAVVEARVAKVLVAAGDTVERDQVLIDLEAIEGPDEGAVESQDGGSHNG